MVGPSQVGASGFLNLIPLFAIVAAYLALDERLDLSQWIGAAVILMSVSALLIWKRSSGTNPTN
jgi:drug/metabolite transporter (DMT)-like permease